MDGLTLARLSIVLPAWNEEEGIGSLVEELDRTVAGRLDPAEIIVVDDASTDGTGRILLETAERLDRLRVVRLPRNAGHGAAVLEGLRRAGGEWVFLLDSDGQFVIGDFWRLWGHRHEADLVLGIRAERHDPLHRLVLSRLVAAVVSLLARRRLRDANVPFRLFRRSLWDDVGPLVGETALAPSILTVLAGVVRGWRVVEVAVTHRPDRRRGSSLRRWKLVRFSARGLVELVRFRLALRRAPKRTR